MNDQWLEFTIDPHGPDDRVLVRRDGFRCQKFKGVRWGIFYETSIVPLALFARPESAMDYWDVVQPVCPQDVSND